MPLFFNIFNSRNLNNNRWYVVGCEPEKLPRLKYVVVLIDRIEELRVESVEFRVSSKVESSKVQGVQEVPEGAAEAIREHFTHIVGVSLNPESRPETVRLKAWKPDAWYIDTKPIHWSQQRVEEADDWMVFTLEVIPNEELVQQLLTYANRLEVLEPLSLRQELVKRAEDILKLNA